MGEQVVIFGGTFNPVHSGHLIVARSVAERLGVAKVVLMPAATPPHKDVALAAADDRLAMLQAATDGDDLFEVSTMELQRQGLSYTCDTLAELTRLRPDSRPVWIIGMDMLVDLGCWRRVRQVLAMARIVTVVRPPMPADLDERLAALSEHFSDEQVRALRADIMPTPLIDISSTEIRRRIAAGLPIDYLTPPKVVQYIRRHCLYRPDR